MKKLATDKLKTQKTITLKQELLFRVLCAFALTTLSLTSHASLIVPATLNPGDTYHVIFTSSTDIDATSNNIAVYDAHVQAAADASNIGTSIGVTWLALGTTATVNAIDHLAPLFTDLSAPIYNQNGDLVATNFNDLWDGNLISPVLFDQRGIHAGTLTWTGSHPGGVSGGVSVNLGGGNAIYGDSTETDIDWISSGSEFGTLIPLTIYGVSSALIVPGAPSLPLQHLS